MEIAREGTRLGCVFYTRSGRKPRRISFLTDFDEAVEVQMHWDEGVPRPCLSHFGEECHSCPTSKTVSHYAWTVRDLDEKRNYVFCFSAGPQTPVPRMDQHWGRYGTLLDRVYLVSVERPAARKSRSKRWNVVPSEQPRAWKRPLGTGSMVPFTADEVYKILLAGNGAPQSRPRLGGGPRRRRTAGTNP